MKRILLVIFFCLYGLSGCALWPIPPNKTIAEAQKEATIPIDTSLTIDDAKRLVNGWSNIYEDAALGRRRWQLGFSEVLFYGSILAVAGSATHHDRVRNVGIGLAGSSSLLAGHYKIDEQLAAFRKAIGRLTCMEEATLQVTQVDIETFEIQEIKTQTAAAELPATLFRNVNRVRRELGDTLNALNLTTPSRADIADAYKKYLAAVKDPPQGLNSLTAVEKNKVDSRFQQQLARLKADHANLAIEATAEKSAKKLEIEAKEADAPRVTERALARKAAFLFAVLGIEEKLELCFKP